MKRKIFLFFIILIFLIASGLVYLNKVILPTKIRSLIIQGLEDATQERVTLDSVQFGLFKGLVLKNLKLYDGPKAVISAAEGRVAFLLPLIFKRNIILQSISLKSAVIFLERRPDNTFNLTGLFHKRETKKERARFNIFISKVSIAGGRVDFQDDTISPVFTKSLDRLDANLYFFLPANVRFDLKCGIAPLAATGISASGNFDIASKKLVSKVIIKNLSIPEFLAYYKDLNISIPQGAIDCLADVQFKDDAASIRLKAKIDGLVLSKDKILARSNSNIDVDMRYGFNDKQLSFQGDAELFNSDILGLDLAGDIKNISGAIHFDNKGLYSDKIKASCLDLPIEARLRITDFNNPLIDIDIRDLDLNAAQKALKDGLKLAIPADLKGNCSLYMEIDPRAREASRQITGHLEVVNAAIKLDNVKSGVEEMRGSIKFNKSCLEWNGLTFKYLGVLYSSSGTLDNFLAPHIKLVLSGKDLALQSVFSINGGSIEVAQLNGKYLDSGFSLAGKLDYSNAGILQTEASGNLNLDFKDIRAPLSKFKNQLEQIDPQGTASIKFRISGNIADFKSLSIDAQLMSPNLTIYGLKSSDLSLVCKQSGGVLEIPSLHFSSYGGEVNAAGALNLNGGHLPYRLSLDIKDIKIEKLKLDTPARQKDISGAVRIQAKFNGFCIDMSRLSGQGTINIAEGKLWQLNLLQGIGKLIFAKDFASIVFNEGYCGFTVRERSIFIDNLKLKSTLVELTGTGRAGFDSTLDGSMEVHVLDQNAPLTSTFKDVATAIIGQCDMFGTIKIGGTLASPKYKFQPAVADIIRGLKKSIFGNILNK